MYPLHRAIPILALALLFGLSACDDALPTETEPPAPTPRKYSETEVRYFGKVALGAEFGGGDGFVKKWDTDIRYWVGGDPDDADRAALAATVGDLEAILGDRLGFEEVGDQTEANVTIWYVPVDEMRNYEPNYVDGNWGYFYLRWTADKAIYNANILIGTDLPKSIERQHLIREEFTQSLGLMNDATDYQDSIFYQQWTTTTSFAPIDEVMVDMLYRSEVQPGMNASTATATLRTIKP